MIKASTTGGAVILGLEPGNIERLREHQPIVIEMAELGHELAGLLLITWGDSEGNAAKPAGHDIEEFERVIVLTDPAIVSIAALPPGEFLAHDMDGIEVRLMIGDVLEMEKHMRKGWTPQTTVTRKGRSPTDAPPSPN